MAHSQPDLQIIKDDLLTLLDQYHLHPKILSVGMELPPEALDQLTDHAHYIPEVNIVRQSGNTSGLQWGITIRPMP